MLEPRDIKKYKLYTAAIKGHKWLKPLHSTSVNCFTEMLLYILAHTAIVRLRHLNS